MHINELTEQFGIELSIVSPSPLRRVPYRAPDGPNVIVEVTGATQAEVDAAREGIIAKAKFIAEKREKHKQKASTTERVSLLGQIFGGGEGEGCLQRTNFFSISLDPSGKLAKLMVGTVH